MPSKLVSFIDVLRSHDLRISPAETLDAVEVISLLGYKDRAALRTGLSQALAKTPDDKDTFRECFDKFFSYSLSETAANDSGEDDGGLDPEQLRAADDALQQLQDGDAMENQPGLDLEGEMLADPQLSQQLDTPLMQMLRDDERNELAVSIARAGERVGLSQIQMFTQKGQYTRKILDELGEEHIRRAVVDLETGAARRCENCRYFGTSCANRYATTWKENICCMRRVRTSSLWTRCWARPSSII